MPDMINEKIKSAEILCIGTELLLGDIVNTNAAYLAGKLAGLGIPVFRQGVVGDNPERLRAAMAESLGRADLLITTGGLGPDGRCILTKCRRTELPCISPRAAAL